eukprot:1503223-Amphidinium_carterae.1
MSRSAVKHFSCSLCNISQSPAVAGACPAAPWWRMYRLMAFIKVLRGEHSDKQEDCPPNST